MPRGASAAAGLQEEQQFPLYIDRFPIQLLNFVRLSRIQDIGQLAKLSLDQDSMVTEMNEYETLQLLMGDLRTRLQEYIENQVRTSVDIVSLWHGLCLAAAHGSCSCVLAMSTCIQPLVASKLSDKRA